MLASSPIRGDENARFTIIEYTELLCPFCQRHSTEGTINSVIEQFPGEVNSISKSFIIHGEEALKLSSAMECIAELKSDVYHETFEKAFEAYPVDMDGLIGIAT
jgi:protein-disulfide isomerase